MLNTLPRKLVAAAISVVVVVVIVIGANWYISRLQNKLSTAERHIAELTAALATQQKTIEQITQDIAAVQEANRVIAGVSTRAQADVNNLRKRFEKNVAGKDRDLGQLAVARPASIQRIVNNGSAEAARCMELASGAPRTAAENAAAKPSEINSLCPGLANPNYVSR